MQKSKKREGDISKLPQWAQDHIADLTRERDRAISDLESYLDTLRPAAFSQLVDAHGPNPSRRRYIDGQSMSVNWNGVQLEVWLVEEGVSITYMSEKRRLSGGAALFPQNGNSILIRQVEYDRTGKSKTG